MASYFDEHDCTHDETQPSATMDLTSILRAFLSGGISALSDVIPHGERLAPPASKSVVETLPRRQTTGDDVIKDCPVCLLPYDGVLIDMPCCHTFHGTCLEPWLKKTNSCPLCRFELVTDDRSYEEYKREKSREKEREQRVEDLHHSMFG